MDNMRLRYLGFVQGRPGKGLEKMAKSGTKASLGSSKSKILTRRSIQVDSTDDMEESCLAVACRISEMDGEKMNSVHTSHTCQHLQI